MLIPNEFIHKSHTAYINTLKHKTRLLGRYHSFQGQPATCNEFSKHPYCHWTFRGLEHKAHGPSSRCLSGFTFKTRECWNMYGKRHRVDGPTRHKRGGQEKCIGIFMV